MKPINILRKINESYSDIVYLDLSDANELFPLAYQAWNDGRVSVANHNGTCWLETHKDGISDSEENDLIEYIHANDKKYLYD